MTTVGVGNDIYPGMGEVNQITGPDIFRNLDTAMARNIAAHNGPP